MRSYGSNDQRAQQRAAGDSGFRLDVIPEALARSASAGSLAENESQAPKPGGCDLHGRDSN
jgi:hypothetical protein